KRGCMWSWIVSTSRATAATPSAPASASSTTSARACTVQATSAPVMIVSAQRGSRRRRASDSRPTASAISARRGPALTAADTGIAWGAPPPVERTATVPSFHSGSSCTRCGSAAAPCGRQRARRGAGAPGGALRLGGLSTLALLLEALALGVGHLANHERSVVDLLLDAVELGLALLGLALTLRLRGHT